MASTTALALALTAQLAAPTHAATWEPARPTITRPSLSPDTVPRRPRLRAQRLSPRKRKSARTFFAAGCVMLGVFYLGGTFVAATQIDDVLEDGVVDPHERDLRRTARLMFVPVIGPIVGAPLADTRGNRAAMVGFGLMQGLGVAYMATGGVLLARDARARRLELGALPTRGGAGVTLRGRF